MAGDDGGGKKKGGEKKNKTMDPSSPYYLHPSENTGVNISGMILNGESNYREWATAMKNALRAKHKLGFIDGTLTKPTDDSDELEDWWSVNSMLVGWIMISIEPGLRSTIAYMDSAKDLWDDLKERFAAGDAMRVHQLREAIRDCRQTGQSVASYFGRLKVLWDELAGYLKVPTCKCGACKCDLVKEMLEERDVEMVHQFLMGLDGPLYGTIRSNILSMSPLPSLSRVYAMIIQEERHKQVTRMRDERAEAVSFAVQGTGRGRGNVTSGGVVKAVCSHWKKEGHEVADCFQLHGYPDWWFHNRGKGNSGNGRGGTSGGVGRGRGTGGRGRGYAVANAAGGVQSAIGAPLTDGDKGSVPTLTNDQWTSLLTMINSLKPPVTTEKLSGPHLEDPDWSG